MDPKQKPPYANRAMVAFLRLFFKYLYNQFAWSYDLVSATVSVGQWNDWIRTTLPHLDGPYILELGHGPGHLQVALREKGVHAVGLDPSLNMNRLAKLKLRRRKFSSLIVNGYAQWLPFPAQSFNQVVATFPSEYILNERTIQEIHRILAPDGLCLILPVGWITGRNLPHRVASALFRLTGQSPDWDDRYLKPLEQFGFSASVIRIDLPASQLLHIHARKSPAMNPDR
jgi:ubiquinone/menaquinone biosynthesis C-methylase UbiE